MKRILGLVGKCAVLSATVSPAFARVAMIETAVPLADESAPTVAAAVDEALRTLVRGARAMGLTHIQITGAAIVEHSLAIGILARDTPATGEPDTTPSPDKSPANSNDEACPPSANDPSSGTAECL
jgi:hypothetical protein